MKSFLNTAKTKLTHFAKRCKKELLALTALVAPMMPMAAFAEGEGLNQGALMKNIVNLITTIFLYIGVLLLAWSIGMLVLAFKNEDADSKSRAMMMMVVSVALVGIKGLLNLIGINNLLNA